MTTHICQSREVEQALIEDGVVKIPFLDRGQLVELQAFQRAIHPNGQLPKVYDNIYMTTWCPDSEYKLAIKQKIEGIFAQAYARHFQHFRSLNHVFIIKNPGQETTFAIHQDWSVVDETRWPSYNIWVPLQDVDEDSGAMWIIKKSHRLTANIRGAGQLFPNYMDSMEELRPYMTSFPMKAGEALVFRHSTIHGSPPNLSDQPRVVAASSIIPKEAELRIHYQAIGGEQIEVVSPADDFIYNYKSLREESVKAPPPGQKLEQIPASDYRQLSITEILEEISA